MKTVLIRLAVVVALLVGLYEAAGLLRYKTETITENSRECIYILDRWTGQLYLVTAGAGCPTTYLR